MFQIDYFKKAGTDADLYAIGNDGKKYDAYYVQRFKMIFFCIPSNVVILGYIKR